LGVLSESSVAGAVALAEVSDLTGAVSSLVSSAAPAGASSLLTEGDGAASGAAAGAVVLLFSSDMVPSGDNNDVAGA
jgi:hypothetical protein